jgi:Sodium/hydrogen exchanger family
VLLVFLPPIIYYAAFGISWQALYANLRPIVLLAVGCVVFITIAVAATAHWLIGMAWPAAFVLGAIFSPPDTVAPLAIARRLRISNRISPVFEGEGLVNDATALVLFNFAVAAVAAGAFSLVRATVTFGAIIVGETVYGLIIGSLMLRLRHIAREPRIEVTLAAAPVCARPGCCPSLAAEPKPCDVPRHARANGQDRHGSRPAGRRRTARASVHDAVPGVAPSSYRPGAGQHRRTIATRSQIRQTCAMP